MKNTNDGFITSANISLYEQVIALLGEQKPEMNARMENTGGGCYGIALTVHGLTAIWGEENYKWVCDVQDADGEHLFSTNNGIAVQAQEVKDIAQMMSMTDIVVGYELSGQAERDAAA